MVFGLHVVRCRSVTILVIKGLDTRLARMSEFLTTHDYNRRNRTPLSPTAMTSSHSKDQTYSVIVLPDTLLLGPKSLSTIWLTPYVHEPKDSEHVCSSYGHRLMSIVHVDTNVAGACQTHVPSFFTRILVKNFVGPPAIGVLMSPLRQEKTSEPIRYKSKPGFSF